MKKIYKVLPRAEWVNALAEKAFTGSKVDIEDGYIHFSTASQVTQTVEKHFEGQKDLLLITVDADQLGDVLKWEPSRGGELFPHLYAELEVSLAVDVQPLIDRADGGHTFPENF